MAQYDYSGYESAFVGTPMGGYGPDMYAETEEERRRREEEERRRQEEAANQVVQSQQVQTRADGSQTITTKAERPARSMAFGPVTGPVMPNAPGVPGAPSVPTLASATADADESSKRRRALVLAALGVPPELASAGSPVELFSRIIGAESGGRHTDAQGNILTSPKGAQGVAQIMPATAAQPGFGIAPATRQEIATPEGNRAFGERYFQGMLNLFGGDQQKAVAAYNAGPGRIQQAERQAAQRGGTWTDYIPRETIAYLGKVFDKIIPSAQAGTLPTQAAPSGAVRQPVQPVAPGEVLRREPVAEVVVTPQGDIVNGVQTTANAQRPIEPVAPSQQPPVVAQPQAPTPGAPVAVTPSSISAAPDTVTAQGQPAPNSFDEFGTPIYSPDQAQLDRQIQAYTTAQGNIENLMTVANDPNARDWIRSQAKNDAADLLVQERERNRAQQKITTMTPQEISREISRPSKEEGSWLKYMLFAALRIEPLMQAEGIKLGIYDKTQYVKDEDGNAFQIRVGGDGTIKSGIDAKTGQPMTEQQLTQAGTMISNLKEKWNTSAELLRGSDGQLYQTQESTTGKTRTVDLNGNPIGKNVKIVGRERDISAADAERLKQQNRVANMDRQLLNDLKKKRGIDVLGALTDFESRLSTPLTDAERMQFIRMYGAADIAGAMPGMPGTTAPGTTPTAPTAAPTAPVAAPSGRVEPVAPTAPTAAPSGRVEPVAPSRPTAPVATPTPAVAATPAAGVARPGVVEPPKPWTANIGKPGYNAEGVPIPMMGEGKAAFDARKKTYDDQLKIYNDTIATGLKEEAEKVGQDIGTIRTNQGKAERQADYLITKMNELLGHPGFETSVGAQGASYLFGLLDKPLPPQLGGGDARDWQNRAREIIGGGFVQAIEALKGFGALSDAEGKAAAAAIQRLGYMDPKTNLPVITATEAEFKAAVRDFQEVIQRNIDGNRAKLGQPPKYGTPPASETSGQPATQPAPAAGTRRTINGVTYVYDGKGWKKL